MSAAEVIDLKDHVAHKELRFAAKVVLIGGGILLGAFLSGKVVAAWHPALYIEAAVLLVFLFRSASYWVKWLPGLLPFGAFNSLIALTSGHSATNWNAHVSKGVAVLLLSFYLAGTVVGKCYSSLRLSVFERCAWLLYLTCMVVPAILAPNDLSRISPVLTWSVVVGIVALVIPLAFRHFGLQMKTHY